MQTTTAKEKYIRIDGTERVCANCAHYILHYAKVNRYTGGLVPINCGHCTHPRIKHRMPFNACEHFTSKEESVCQDSE